MKKLALNMEYAKRHLFVVVLMTALGGWFGYDGFVRYPATSAGDLYRFIEGAEPSAGVNLDAFKKQKTQTQYGFTFLCFAVAAIVGLRLWKAKKFSFEYDDNSFVFNGRKCSWDDVKEIDRKKWEKKSIAVLKLKDGTSIVLDGWHHRGVLELLVSK